MINKPKISFVASPSPALLDENGSPYGPIRTNTFPQSQITLASSLASVDVEAELLDIRTIDNPNEWKTLASDEFAEPVAYGNKVLTRHFIGDYKARIRQSSGDIDVYVLTSNFTYEANCVRQIIKELKAFNPSALMLVGGRDASAAGRHQFYFEAGADFIGLGDGDASLKRFLEDIIENNLQRQTNRFIMPSQLSKEDLPFIDLGILGSNKARYNESGGGNVLESIARKGFAAYIEVSRGCARYCPFCVEANSDKLYLDADRSKKQIDHFASNGAGLFMFSDDNLLERKDSDLIDIFQHLKSKNVGWEFPVGLEIERLADKNRKINERLADALFWNNGKRENYAGAHRMLFPVEDSLMRRTKLKKLRNNVYKEVLAEILKRELPYINIGIMIGSEQETPEERLNLERNLDFLYDMAADSNTKLNFSIFCTMPLPGTPLYTAMERQGRIAYDINKVPELWNVFASVIKGDHFSPEETAQYRRDLLQKYNMQQEFGKVNPK